ncbi:MAG: hypothetical protein HXY40_14485 [Chloroflexi bacterium]|nr:hypothetical protein [Chloroflexota bacterium]
MLVDESCVWLSPGQGPRPEDFPAGADGVMSAAIQVDLATMEVVNTLDLCAFEQENNDACDPERPARRVLSSTAY